MRGLHLGTDSICLGICQDTIVIKIQNGTIYHTDKDGKAKNMRTILFQIFANMDPNISWSIPN